MADQAIEETLLISSLLIALIIALLGLFFAFDGLSSLLQRRRQELALFCYRRRIGARLLGHCATRDLPSLTDAGSRAGNFLFALSRAVAKASARIYRGSRQVKITLPMITAVRPETESVSWDAA
jgi:hypothetical protein